MPQPFPTLHPQQLLPPHNMQMGGVAETVAAGQQIHGEDPTLSMWGQQAKEPTAVAEAEIEAVAVPEAAVGEKRKRADVPGGVLRFPAKAAAEGFEEGMLLLKQHQIGRRLKAAYIEDRMSALEGQTVGFALLQYNYVDAQGQLKKYQYGDLKYDIKSGDLADPRPASAVAISIGPDEQDPEMALHGAPGAGGT